MPRKTELKTESKLKKKKTDNRKHKEIKTESHKANQISEKHFLIFF